MKTQFPIRSLPTWQAEHPNEVEQGIRHFAASAWVSQSEDSMLPAGSHCCLSATQSTEKLTACPVLACARYVELFAEEVVRGGPAFAVSLVLSSLEPALRAAAELGAWQIISPVNALGRVEVVAGLYEVQDKARGQLPAFPC